jgi:uncharacterized MnhB-related membrane protein
MKFAKILIAGSAAAALAAGAHANCDPKKPCYGNLVLNGQLSIGQTVSTVTANISNVPKDVTVTTAAIGNSLSVEVAGDTRVDTKQVNGGEINANTHAAIYNVHGDVAVTTAAIGNSANIKVKDAYATEVNNHQWNGRLDPYAFANVNVGGVGGDVAVTTAAIGNTLGVETPAQALKVTSHQENWGPNISTMNANVHNVGGSVAITGAAIGNSVSIKAGGF